MTLFDITIICYFFAKSFYILVQMFIICYCNFFVYFFRFKIKTQLIKQLTGNETGGGISTSLKPVSRSQLLVQQNSHNYLGEFKDSKYGKFGFGV